MGFLENLLGLGDSQQAHARVYQQDQVPEEHKSSFTHELISGAAGFEAMKAYEHHVAQNGPPPSHQLMKELLAGFAAAEVDKQFESKGLNWLDREKAKRGAIEQAHHLADQQYGAGNVQPDGHFGQQNMGYAQGFQQSGYGGQQGGGYGGQQGGGYGGQQGGGYGGQQGGYEGENRGEGHHHHHHGGERREGEFQGQNQGGYNQGGGY
ncbi:hypothetical protein HKX48_003539 [Thoreauomyces humboldtii]|nr:hypothetical protein HKX48_003539 [Thoreauomyces humboldtii]